MSVVRFNIILLLGSYDPFTSKVLNRLKENLSKEFVHNHDNIIIFIIDNIEIYTVNIKDENQEDSKLILIAEQYDHKLTVFTTDGQQIFNAEDLQITKDIDETVSQYIKEKYNITTFFKHPILEKLGLLAEATSLFFLVRHRDLTRGGEYIELAYLLSSKIIQPSNLYFLKRECFNLSSMALEILDQYDVVLRSYKNEKSLNREAVRIVKYFIQRHT
ncbi:MAG TPA: hypothetical protein VH796_19275 [Nitrososphaeraceae archaeon]